MYGTESVPNNINLRRNFWSPEPGRSLCEIHSKIDLPSILMKRGKQKGTGNVIVKSRVTKITSPKDK